MRNWLSIVIVGLAGLTMLACGDGGSGDPFSAGSGGFGGTGGVALNCTTLTAPPEDCEKSCNSDSQCEASFCSNGSCLAQCTATEGCGDNATCNTRGRCVPNLNTGGTGGTGNSIGCQSVEITPTRIIPNVMFLVDRSGSMTSSFGGQPRWTAAHDAIVAIVQQLESIVRFGVTSYHSNDQPGSTNQNPIPDPMCPRLDIQLDMELGSAAEIEASFPSTFPGGDDTPTGDSIDALVSIIQNNPPPADGPTILVLATDGEPDTCEIPDPQTGQAEAVAAATASHAAEIDLFILSVGNEVSDEHLQEMANVGVGLPVGETGPGAATFWKATDPGELAAAFDQIIGDSISCDIQMDKRFDDKDKACNDPESDVQLNGTPLSCPSEWRVKPGVDDVIELVGDACDTFKSGSSTFSAVFPCGAIVVE